MKALRRIGTVVVFVGAAAVWAVDKACPFQTAKGRSVCAAAKEACEKTVKAEDVHAEISTDALSALLRSGVKMHVFDARSGKYDDGRRIPGAQSMAWSTEAKQMEAAAGSDKGELIVTYCSNPKCPASKRLATALRKLGYVNVIEYSAGIDGWAAAGKTIVKVGT